MRDYQKRYHDIHEEIDRVRARRDERAAQLARLNKRIGRMWDRSHWIDLLARPLAEEIAAHIGAESVSVMGPFGLGAQVGIYLMIRDGTLGYLSLEPSLTDPEPWFYYHTTEETGTYPKGSIGEINGLNYRRERLPEDITEIVALIRYRPKKED